MMTESSVLPAPRIRWSWLSTARADILWNLAFFWVGYLAIALLWMAHGSARELGGTALKITVGGTPFYIGTWAFLLYGPLVDAPHIGATIARTYVDAGEWAIRRKLFLGALVWFVIGPAVILLPYAITALFNLSSGWESIGWVAWGHFFTLYALFHINKQHWGFVALYKRKNNDLGSPLENRIDQLFFYTGIWLPFFAMMTSSWFRDPDGSALGWVQTRVGDTTVGAILHPVCIAGFFLACAAYTVFQLVQWQRGIARNGPKLLYLATVIPLQYLAFAIDPFVAAFWIITTGLGHCAQYHHVIWGYGQRKYVEPAATATTPKDVPTRLFSNVWLYIAFVVLFGLVTLQGPGKRMVIEAMAKVLDAGVFHHLFTFLNSHDGIALGVKVAAAFLGGVRLHHFYVDSKIWKVSKNKSLAANLNV